VVDVLIYSDLEHPSINVAVFAEKAIAIERGGTADSAGKSRSDRERYFLRYRSGDCCRPIGSISRDFDATAARFSADGNPS
jgi:hypothetical protein